VLFAGFIAAMSVPWAGHALDRAVYDTDELEETLSGLDRFLAVPCSSLCWPGTVQLAPFVPLIGVDYALRARLHVTPLGFAEYLSAQYRDPQRAIRYMRLIVIAFTSIGFALLALRVWGYTESALAGGAALLLPVIQPLLRSHGVLGMADGPALGLLAGGLAMLLAREPQRRHVALAGLLMGLALASKVTVALALPLVVVLALANTRRPVRDLVLLGVCIGAFFVVGCPYVVFEPLRFAKNVIGNMRKPGAPLGAVGAVVMIVRDVLTWPLAVGLLAALGVMLWRRAWGVPAGVLGCVAAAILLTMRSAQVVPRYYGALAVVAVLTVALLLDPRWALRLSLTGTWRTRGWLVLLACVALLGSRGPQALRALVDRPPAVYPQVAREVGSLPSGTRVAVPLAMSELLGQYAASDAQQRLARDCGIAMQSGRATEAFVEARVPGLERALAMLPSVMNENEQVYVGRMLAAAGPSPHAGVDLYLVASAAVAARFGVLTPETAADAWRSGTLDVLVLDAPLPDVAATRTYGDGANTILWRYDRLAPTSRP
jgi:hypothetical protein